MFNVSKNQSQTFGNIGQMLNSVLQNPQFQKFVEENKDLSPEEVCKKFNINPVILNFLK